jgi:hypothetical protein
MSGPTAAPRIPRIPDPHTDDHPMVCIALGLFALSGVMVGIGIGFWIWG